MFNFKSSLIILRGTKGAGTKKAQPTWCCSCYVICTLKPFYKKELTTFYATPIDGIILSPHGGKT